MLLYNTELADDFGEDDGLSRDALRVPSRVAIERRRRRRRCRRPQLQTPSWRRCFAMSLTGCSGRRASHGDRTATTATSTQTPVMVEAAVQCQLIDPPNDDEEADENYDADAAETDPTSRLCRRLYTTALTTMVTPSNYTSRRCHFRRQRLDQH
jgi:hypothetical protein